MASLFTLRVCLQECGDDSVSSELAHGETSASVGSRSENQGSHEGSVEDPTWHPLPFSAGNPRSTIITGALHLFRDTLSVGVESPPIGPTHGSSHGNAHQGVSALPKGRQPLVCVLAVPSTMSVGDFCRFAAALVPKVVEMRMVLSEGARGLGLGRSTAADGSTDSTSANTRRTDSTTANSKTDSTYSVILRFVDQTAADAFAVNYHDRKFSALGDETCKVLFVRRVEVLGGSGGRNGKDNNDKGVKGTKEEGEGTGEETAKDDHLTHLTEVPSCPVCLDRLDQDASGVVTTVCSHAFHAGCIEGWNGNSCPVCRYTTDADQVPRCAHPGCVASYSTQTSVATASPVATASTSTLPVEESLWACLICGSVGCGRYTHGKHALSHFHETSHCYALELRTQRVWDYVRDGFVHRLIQSKTGLVELAPGGARHDVHDDGRAGVSSSRRGYDHSPDAGDTSRKHGRSRGVGNPDNAASSLDHGLAEYDTDYPLDPGLEEALVSSKLSAIHAEYSALLTSQLDEQRGYFEGVVAAATAEKEGALSAAVAAERQAGVIASAVRDAREARSELAEANAALAKCKQKVQTQQTELEFLKQINEQMTLNQTEREKTAEAASETSTSTSQGKDLRITDLEEQLRDLMVCLDAREMAGGGAGAGGSGSRRVSIAGGEVLGVAPPRERTGADDAPSRSDVHARLQKKLEARRQKRGG